MDVEQQQPESGEKLEIIDNAEVDDVVNNST